MKKIVLFLMSMLIGMMSFANEAISVARASEKVVTVAEFLAAEESASVWYKLTGSITNITNTTYGNFDLKDETGSVYVYGLTATQVSSNDKSFSSLGLVEGDIVTIVGIRSSHNGKPQVKGPAYYISHKTPEEDDSNREELGEGYSKVTNIATLVAGDKVVLYADDVKLGVTGWNGNKDATVAASGWVEYVVEIANADVLLKDGDKYISLTTKNRFGYSTTGSACYTTTDGKFYCQLDGNSYYLYENSYSSTIYYRMYTDKSSSSAYKPFYMYKIGESSGEINPDITPQPEPDINIPAEVELTRAEYWYDFTGSSEKGIVRSGFDYDIRYYHLYTSGTSNGYKAAGYIAKGDGLSTRSTDRIFIEDINGDGKMDIGVEVEDTSHPYETFISSTSGIYSCEKDAMIIPNFDVNSDGRLDYLRQNGTSWAIMVQQANGTFVKQHMQAMTLAEYESEFDPEAWGSTKPSTWSGLLSGSPTPSTAGMFGGASLAKAPQRRVSTAQHAQGINNLISAPTRALDLNADGMMDLVNEKDGVIYYNVGDGKWVMSDISGTVMIADLNGDAIQDFIYPGAKLQTVIYRGEGKFDTQILYENIQVDPDMYCYDFDKDGDVDILVTFSAPLNSTGYAYTMFFENDGTGKFTQLAEQDYGEGNTLLFSNCQDVDGDGYYDMLAFRSNFSIYDGNVQCNYEESIDVVWMKGSANKTFSQPEVLITYAAETHRGFNSHRDVKINAEDIDNDGKIEIWSSYDEYGLYDSYGFPATIAEVPSTINTTPTAPQKPTLIYNNGILLVNWGDGSDTETATSDLTYALRIGTTPGGNDILRAHANADGSRRNFLDGNMGKYHNYKLDLSGRVPSTIYVSVQTIDAQHKGSAWSEEASIEHTTTSAEFRLNRKELAKGQTLIATAYELPEGYTHTWQAENGEITDNGYTAQIVFNATGTKTITHTITATNGTSVSAVESVNVTPNYATAIGTTIPSTLQAVYSNDVSYTGVNRMLADYNMDGYWDLIGSEAITYGDYLNVVSKGEANYGFTKASGIWNTGLDVETAIWYDWDHNGAADAIFRTSSDNNNECYYLPHNGTNNLQAKKSDENLAALNLQGRTTSSDDRYPAYITNNLYPVEQFIDFTHNGYYDVYANNNNKPFLWSRQSDGSYQPQEITGTFDFDNLNNTFGNNRFHKDINRDGFTDVCALKNKESEGVTYPYTELTVMINKGNYEFEQLLIPFVQEIAAGDYSDLNNPYLEDMNNDGYLDIVAMRQDAAIYVMWNEKNERFSAPEVLPLGELEGFYKYSVYSWGLRNWYVEDIDNNGYLDVISMQQDKSAGDDVYGTYVHYFDADGVALQGFIETHTVYDNPNVAYTEPNLDYIFKFPNHQWTIATSITKGHPSYSSTTSYHKLQGTTNERPSAPNGVRAVQTSDGLLIEWGNAKDDFTPAVQMQYNLSVKTKGASGAGAYIISPQNACNSDAAPVRNYDYIRANQYLVPLSALPVGEYEIQVQAIDMQGDWSEFSAPITVAVQRESVIDAPTTICIENSATFRYMGAASSATPVWEFDGAEVLSGSGYGPYELQWNSAGTKTVTLTIDGNTESRMIYVEANEANVELPSTMIVDVPTTISIPTGMTAKWYMKYADDTDYMPMNNFNKEVKIENNTITVLSTEKEDIDIMLELTNANGCETVFEQRIEVVSTENMPKIWYVTSNAEAKNVIYWKNNSTKFTQVRILKETNRYNQFIEIGVAPIANGSYTDMSSNATVRAERYMIQPIMGDAELPIINVHQTAHLTINRGLNDQTWNLIWNCYEGADVVSYNILRGASADKMIQIASVSSSNTSYTDFAPESSAPYYAIEYLLASDVASAPKRIFKVANNTASGKTNVVDVANANTLVYAETISIHSANNKYKTTTDNTMLLLYAELMPTGTTYKQVRWEITSGSDLATIDQSGLLTACTPNKGGTVTVKATTIDGTNISATRQITIAAIAEESKPTEPTYFTVTFQDWDGTILKTEQVEQGKSATAPANPVRKGYTFIGWDKGFSNVQSDLTITAQYKKSAETDVENIENTSVKIYTNNGVIYIEGAEEDYHVLDAAGRLIYSGRDAALALPRGVYVVVVGDEVEKVVL